LCYCVTAPYAKDKLDPPRLPPILTD
jgi:hypothetical protein